MPVLNSYNQKKKEVHKMANMTLGSTGICVNKNGFGALPIQRISKEAAVCLIRRAYEGGITFFDTARSYTDSEVKLGEALKVYVIRSTLPQRLRQIMQRIFGRIWKHP